MRINQSKVTVLFDTNEIKFNRALEELHKGNDKVALSLLYELIDEGYYQAYYILGMTYENGTTNIKTDYSKAIKYYELATETRGTVDAYLGLAKMCVKGLGMEPDYCRAFAYYSTLIDEFNHIVAYINMGLMYKDGLCVEMNYDKARQYFEYVLSTGCIFGLTCLGLLEQKQGHWIKGWCTRVKAGWIGGQISWREGTSLPDGYNRIIIL